MRLLLVEDHERFAAFVKKGLEAGGFTVDFVYNAEDVDVAVDNGRLSVVIQLEHTTA